MILHFKEHRLHIGQAKLAVGMLPQGMKLVRGNTVSLDGVMSGCEECTLVADKGSGDFGGLG